MKIHPLFEKYLSNGFVPEKSSDSFRAADEWYKAGRPVVEEPPSIWDDKGTGKLGTMLDAKDARIKELERETKGAVDLYKMALSRAATLGEALNTSAKKIKGLEAEVAQWKNTLGVVDSHHSKTTTFSEDSPPKDYYSCPVCEKQETKIKELEKKLAEALRDGKDWVHFGRQTCDSSWNAALEEAAKEAADWAEAPAAEWPSWLQDTNRAATVNLIEVTRTNFRRFAARIRALKKPTPPPL